MIRARQKRKLCFKCCKVCCNPFWHLWVLHHPKSAIFKTSSWVIRRFCNGWIGDTYCLRQVQQKPAAESKNLVETCWSLASSMETVHPVQALGSFHCPKTPTLLRAPTYLHSFAQPLIVHSHGGWCCKQLLAQEWALFFGCFCFLSLS